MHKSEEVHIIIAHIKINLKTSRKHREQNKNYLYRTTDTPRKEHFPMITKTVAQKSVNHSVLFSNVLFILLDQTANTPRTFIVQN